jgi:ATP-dependent Lhr-like helicase
MNTIAVVLAGLGRRVGQDGLAITVGDCTPAELRDVVRALVAAPPPDPVWLAATVRAKAHEKYDRYLSAELLDIAYAARALDVPGAWACLAEIGARRPRVEVSPAS